jgi:anti-anti-sigma regulatory factor
MELEGMTVTRSISVAELNDVHWIRVRGGELDREAAEEIRQACLRGLDRGVAKIVVELTGVARVCPEGIDVIQAAADELDAKSGALSLVVRQDPRSERVDLRRVPASGLEELTGLCIALDEALHESRNLRAHTTRGGQDGD